MGTNVLAPGTSTSSADGPVGQDAADPGRRQAFGHRGSHRVGSTRSPDGPSVLGWERWREICLRHSVGLVAFLLAAVITAP